MSTPGRTSSIEISTSKFIVNNRFAVAITPGLCVLGAILPLANMENSFGFDSVAGNNDNRRSHGK